MDLLTDLFIIFQLITGEVTIGSTTIESFQRTCLPKGNCIGEIDFGVVKGEAHCCDTDFCNSAGTFSLNKVAALISFVLLLSTWWR